MLLAYAISTVKFENFRENCIFAKNFKRHVWDVKNLQLEHVLPRSTSVNGRVISPFHEDFIFVKLRYENKILAKINVFTVPKSHFFIVALDPVM